MGILGGNGLGVRTLILVYFFAAIGVIATLAGLALIFRIILTDKIDALDTDAKVIEIRNYDI